MMKQLIKALVFGCVLGLALSCIKSIAFEIAPYIGADTRMHNFRLDSKLLGDSKIHYHASTYHIYGGLQLTEILGLELGGEVSDKKAHVSSKTTIKASGYHLSLISQLPISDMSSLLFGVGGVRAKVSFESNKQTTDIKKIIPRFLAGLQFKLTDKVGLRTTALVDRISGLHKDNKDKVKFSSAIHYGVGLNYLF